MEYLVTMTAHVPDGTPEQAVGEVRAREAAHWRDLAAAGQLLRLWRPPLLPGEWRSLGLFAAGGAGQLQQILASMPLKIWRTDQVTPLAAHPGDPGPGARPARSGAEFLAAFVVSIPMARPAGPWKTPRRARRHARANWLTRDTSSGCGHFRVRDALSACTGPGTARR
jgi:muconolactone delta-isomerase